MARKPRVDHIGFHHVANQGMHLNNIFATIKEKEVFFEILCKACKSYGVIVHDYCLMDNHYHLLVETTRENLSLFMRQLNGNYAIYFNRARGRSGPLWQGRYKSWHIIHKAYLDYTIKYIEQDPVNNDAAFFALDYPYTLAAAIMSVEPVVPCAQESMLIKEFTEQELKLFLQNDLTKDELGALENEKRKKIIKQDGQAVQERSRPLESYFTDIVTRQERNEAMSKAYLDGYSQGEIARQLGVSSALVSYSIKKLSEK